MLQLARLVLPALLLAQPAWSQLSGGYVERAVELGLIHEVVSGLDQLGESNVVDTFQAGVSVGDLDGDGDLDVYVAGGVGPSRMFRNEGGSFTDVTAALSIETGDLDRVGVFADYDRDGDLDLFVGMLESGNGDSLGRGRLYLNNGVGDMRDASALSSPLGAGHTIFAQWADFDHDGLLDLYTCEFHGSLNRWYRNNGDGTLVERGALIGLDHPGASHASAVFDSDGDGLLDAFVGNDYVAADWAGLATNTGDAHFRGRADHTFIDVSEGSGYDQMVGIMGLALGDVDYDGDLDIYKTDVRDNWMMMNAGWPGSGVPWERQDAFYGIANPFVPDPDHPSGLGLSVGWAAIFLNADFDPYLDLFLVNGKVAGVHPVNPYTPSSQPNYLFHGDGPGNQFKFTDRSVELGIDDNVDDRGAAAGDIDGDGDVDLLVTPTSGRLRYYENRVEREGQGTLVVRAECGTSAPGGIGTVVSWTDSLGYPHLRMIGGDGPTASQHDSAAYFALGAEPAVDVTVRFQSGLELTYPQVAANSELVAVEPELVRVPSRTVAIATGKTIGPGSAGAGAAVGAPHSGTFEILVAAHDRNGNPLGPDADVAIEMPRLRAAGPVEHVTSNRFRREFFLPAQTGTHRVRARFDDFQLAIQPAMHFYDRTDVSATTVRLMPECVRAGSGDTFEVHVVPKATGGMRQQALQSVSLTVAGQTPLFSTALTDGFVAYTFEAPNLAGDYPIEVTLDGALLAGAPKIEVAGPASKGQTEVQLEQPLLAQSAAPHQLKLKLTPRDDQERRLGPGAVLDLSAIPAAGTVPVTLRGDLFSRGQDDGDFVFVLEKPLGTPDGDATGDLQLVVDGVDLGLFPYAF
ncbi:MAG: VCBS repeat-containing protein [Planctomycetota bacterium]